MKIRPLVAALCLAFFIQNSPNASAAAVATSSSQATEAAMQVLKNGGNAIDAACTAVWVLGVSQPDFTGLGAGGFAVVKVGEKTAYYDFREQSPASTQSLAFYKDGKLIDSDAERNTIPQSVGIPGMVAGCEKLLAAHGTISWKASLGPAIAAAKQGIPVTEMFESELVDQFPRISRYAGSKDLLGGVSAQGLKRGESLKQPLLADTYEKLASSGPRAFYEGDWAKGWIDAARDAGVDITASDVSQYQVAQREPGRFTWRKLKGVTATAPSVGGIAVVGPLRYLEHYYAEHEVPEKTSALRYITEIEALAYFRKLARASVTDPAKATSTGIGFEGSDGEKAAWKEIDTRVAQRLQKVGIKTAKRTTRQKRGVASLKRRKKGGLGSHYGHTTHMSIVDDAGNAVALTSSVQAIFGSGIVVPKYGFLLNSTNADFNPEVGHINSPAPHKRPRSNQSPTILMAGDSPVAVLGAAGGGYIPSAVVQFAQNYFVFGMNAKDALAFPRVHANNETEIELEVGAGSELKQTLETAGYTVSSQDPIWAVFEGAVRRGAQQAWEAVADARYDGLALTSGS